MSVPSRSNSFGIEGLSSWRIQMSRELTHDLFGELPTLLQKTNPRPLTEVAAVATTEDLKFVGFQVDGMSRKLKEFESKLELMSSKMDEFSATNRLRFERIQGHFQRQTEAIQSNFRDVHQKIATVASRINERKLSDANITDMVERHQQLVQT